MSSKVQYYVRVDDRSILDKATHYRSEMDILESLASDLDYDFELVTHPKKLSPNTDLFYARWATTGIVPIMLSKLTGSPTILVSGGSEIVARTDVSYPEFYHKRPLWHRLVIRTSLTAATQVVVPSEYLRGQVADIAGTDANVIPHFVDAEQFSPGSPDPSGLPFPEGEYILTISWLDHAHIKGKRLKNIIETVARTPDDVKLVIIGEDKGAYDDLAAYVAELGIEDQVAFVRESSMERKVDLLRGARLSLQPTLHEGFGAAILEAMSVGTPVVSSRRGAVPEVLGDAGEYVAPKDVDEMTEAVESLWDDEPARRSMSERGRNRVLEEFSIEVGRERIRALIAPYV